MGRWLAALRNDEKKSEIATDENRQNPQNSQASGFEGFEGSRSGAFAEITVKPSKGFEGFEGSPVGQIQNFVHLIDDRSAWDEEDWQAAFEERAAILEYDAGLPRLEAEARAVEQIEAQRRRLLQ
jgi:hypothetical protein